MQQKMHYRTKKQTSSTNTKGKKETPDNPVPQEEAKQGINNVKFLVRENDLLRTQLNNLQKQLATIVQSNSSPHQETIHEENDSLRRQINDLRKELAALIESNRSPPQETIYFQAERRMKSKCLH